MISEHSAHSKETSKPRITAPLYGEPSVTNGYYLQMASNAEGVE